MMSAPIEARAYGGLDFSGHLEDQGEEVAVFLIARALEVCKPREPFLLPTPYVELVKSS